MPGTQQVRVTVTTANAQPVTTPSFNVGMLAGYHSHWTDRQRVYSSPEGMLGDGFLSTEPLYRAAEIYFSQTPSPAQLVVGRRANAYTQVLDLLLTDTTGNATYSFSVIGSDDVVHPVLVPSTGVPATDAATIAALFAQTTVTPGSSNVGSLALTVASGTPTANGNLNITITTGGASGTARFAWTFGLLGGTGVATGASVPLSGTGLTLDFGSGTATIGDTYTIACVINVGTVGHSSPSTSYVTFTQATGKLNDIVGWMNGPNGQIMQLTDATTDPGIAADLAAIYAVNTLNWYAFGLDSNSKAEDLAGSAWAQSAAPIPKFFFTNNSDYACVNGAGISTSDVFATAQSDSYGKVEIGYSGQQVLCYQGISLMSYAMAHTPGFYVLADKALPGVLTETDQTLTLTQAEVLNTQSASQPGTGGKNGNYYVNENGQNVFWPGVTPFGYYTDYPIWVDYIEAQIQASVQTAKTAGPKLSYDNQGLQAIYSAILAPLVQAATPDANGNVAVLMSSIVVNVPTLDEIAQASIAARDVPNATWSCQYVGGILTVTANGTVTL